MHNKRWRGHEAEKDYSVLVMPLIRPQYQTFFVHIIPEIAASYCHLGFFQSNGNSVNNTVYSDLLLCCVCIIKYYKLI